MMNKKGYIHHPIVAMLIGFLLGGIIVFMMAKGVIPSPISICPG